jgi:hypothetical protein
MKQLSLIFFLTKRIQHENTKSFFSNESNMDFYFFSNDANMKSLKVFLFLTKSNMKTQKVFLFLTKSKVESNMKTQKVFFPSKRIQHENTKSFFSTKTNPT